MKKNIIAITVTSALIMSMLTGCSSVPFGAATTTTESTEPAVRWADEMGVVTTDKREFSMPGFPYYMSDDRKNHCTEVYPISADMKYKIVSAEASEPDKYGQVHYTIKYDYDVELWVNDEDSDKADKAGFPKVNALTLFFNVVDSNTGLVPNAKESNGMHKNLGLTETEWEGKKFTIGWSMEGENSWGDWITIENDDGTTSSSITLHRNATMHVYAPEGYDGLYIFITKNGDTEFDDTRFAGKDAHQWGADEGDVSDYYFIKVTDLL